MDTKVNSYHSPEGITDQAINWIIQLLLIFTHYSFPSQRMNLLLVGIPIYAFHTMHANLQLLIIQIIFPI